MKNQGQEKLDSGEQHLKRSVLQALLFFPRGGSAQVVRSLARELPHHGWHPKLVCGSRTDQGSLADAHSFYAGLDVVPVDFTPALGSQDPMQPDDPTVAPMQPSYEQRDGALDTVFAALDDSAYRRQVDGWARALEQAGASRADLLHLHHLTPIQDAARSVAPDLPLIAHIHGTDLRMLEAIERGAPVSWRFADRWAERLRDWAASADSLIAISSEQIELAERVLGVDSSRFTLMPNGFNPSQFKPLEIDRANHWSHYLVEQPLGWLPGGEPGSARYTPAEIEVFDQQNTVILCVGRFTRMKRLDLLIAAYAKAQKQFERPAPLVLLGGFPGECEGEHPVELGDRFGARNIFLAGWHEHNLLPQFFGAADLVVLASPHEPFGQVVVEGMACGLPSICADSGGPADIVEDGQTGWLVEPDDVDALAAALIEAVSNTNERRRRSEAALAAARERYSWPALVEQMSVLYERLVGQPRLL